MTANQSDFERERQRILAEIEARARKNGGELTLQDWLKAAEEVMPDEDKRLKLNLKQFEQSQQVENKLNLAEDDVVVKLSSTPPLRSAQDNSPHTAQTQGKQTMEHETAPSQKKNFIFTSIVFGTLTVFLLALGGFAYLHVQKEITALNTSLQQVQKQLGELNVKLETLEKQQVTGGDSAAFDALLARLAKLEQRIEQKPAALPMEQVSDQIKSELTDSNVITEAVLDAKLDQFSKRIEQAIDKRFITILAQLKHLNAARTAPSENTAPAAAAPKQEETAAIAAPTAPVPPKVDALQVVPSPETQPISSGAPKLNGDEQWLAAVANGHYVLQLASVLDRKSLERLKQQKGLTDARIVRQKRGGQTFYVLVLGDYPDRTEAKAAAQHIRSTTGINPWVRPAKDLKRNLYP